MRYRAFIAMAAWLVLFGCDDDKPNVRTSDTNSHFPNKVVWKEKGCSGDVADIDIEGEKGKMTIVWDYTPAVIITLTMLTFVAGVARRETREA